MWRTPAKQACQRFFKILTGRLPIPRGHVVHSVEQAMEAAEKIGFPLVVKGLSPDVLHKTEAGAVRLDIGNMNDLKTSFEMVACAVRDKGADSSFRGVLVEQMLPEPVAELIIGSVSDVPGFQKVILAWAEYGWRF